MFLTTIRQLNANRCVVTKIKRATFARLHPTTAVLPDGSTINVKYSEPRHLIKFPIKLEEATEEDKRRVQLLRKGFLRIPLYKKFLFEFSMNLMLRKSHHVVDKN